jgi:molybdopterin converting factor subunit 1
LSLLAIRVKVLYFGQAREAAGTGSEVLSIPRSSSVGSLVARSTQSHAGLRRMSGSMRIAVNEELAEEDERLEDGDVVAFLPPVAGG